MQQTLREEKVLLASIAEFSFSSLLQAAVVAASRELSFQVIRFSLPDLDELR